MNTEQSNKCIIVLLGTAQDAGVPQLGCNCINCIRASDDKLLKRAVASLAILNPVNGKCYIVDSTPDFKEQFNFLQQLRARYITNGSHKYNQKNRRSHSGLDINGLLLTHAHIGHYIGLVQFGKEVCETRSVPVYATKAMKKFLNSNQPFKTLIKNENINLRTIIPSKPCLIEQNLTITSILIQHRADFSDTVGFLIEGPNKRILYAPDMDKITPEILKLLPKIDIAIIDGTFFDKDELSKRRKIDVIPHPIIQESIKILKPYVKRTMIYFTHFNHTNSVLDAESEAAKWVKECGFGLVQEKWTLKI